MSSGHYQTQTQGSPAPILWYASLPDHVKRLYDHKSKFADQPALMVVLADVVCQAFTVWALEALFKHRGVEDLWQVLSAGSKIRRLQDIANEDARKIYTTLSGDDVSQKPFWADLKRHNDRRNALVHPNRDTSAASVPLQQEANESFKAVEDYIQHVHQVLKNIGVIRS